MLESEYTRPLKQKCLQPFKLDFTYHEICTELPIDNAQDGHRDVLLKRQLTPVSIRAGM